MFEPSGERVKDFLKAQSALPFSYREVGASRDEVPPNYPVNHHRIQIGSGAKTFAAAVKALRHWTMYDLRWTRLYPTDAPVAVGEVVCVVVDHGFCWSLNPCRIVYVLEENGSIERSGFAIGTLPGHSEEGEERFIVEWRREDDSVWFEIFSFARPHNIFARIGFPLVSWFQNKFAADAQSAMIEALREESAAEN